MRMSAIFRRIVLCAFLTSNLTTANPGRISVMARIPCARIAQPSRVALPTLCGQSTSCAASLLSDMSFELIIRMTTSPIPTGRQSGTSPTSAFFLIGAHISTVAIAW